jgi:thiol:disulfide interchange protein
MKTPGNHDNSFSRQSIAIILLFTAVLLIVSLLPWLHAMAAKLHLAAPPGHIAWQTSLAQAKRQSAITGRPVLVDFQASWCPPCQMMDREVWTDQGVAKLVAAHFIPVKENMDAAMGKAAATKLGVETLPTILVLNGQGEIINAAQTMGRQQTRKFLTNSLNHIPANR